MKRLRVYYSGMVQGVGFRYTAQDIAERLGVTGWVRNLQNGGVELIAEGREQVLKSLIAKIDSAMKSYIRNADISWADYVGEFDDFQVRFF